MRGKEIRSPEQLAVLAQVYRDPRFETLRFFYVRNDVIVGHEGITSKLPAASVAFLNIPNRDNCINDEDFFRKVKNVQVRFFFDMLDRMERLNADGYYLLHNHPTGIDVSPSTEDVSVSDFYKNTISGFKGHIIINSNKYGLIDENLQTTKHDLNMGEDMLLKPSKPHSLLGEIINSSGKLAQLSKSVQLDDNYSVLTYVNSKNVIRAIQEVPDGIFKREKECIDYLRGRMYEFGASRAFLITSSQHVKIIAVDMIQKGYLLDAIITDKNYAITSVRESGINPYPNSPDKWMELNVNKGYKVKESDRTNPYHAMNSTQRTLRSNTGRLERNKRSLPEMGI